MAGQHTVADAGTAPAFAELERRVAADPAVTLCLDGERVVQCEQVLRHLPGRRVVLAGRIKGEPVVAKIFSKKGKAAREFHREYRTLYELARKGLPVPEPLVRTEQPDWHALVVPRLDGIAAGRVYRQREMEPGELQRRLVRTVEQLFHAGFRQTDLHLDNFLFAGNTFYVLDAGSITKLAPEPLASLQLRDSIARLLSQFYPADIDWSVADVTASGNRDYDKLARVVGRRRRARLRTLVRKSLRSSTRYKVLRRKDVEVVCIRSCGDALERMLERGLDEAMEEGERLKDGNSATVARYRGGGVDWVIKRYNAKGAGVAIKRLFVSRARRSWQNALWLQFNGLATPGPVAFVREKRTGVQGRHYYISAHVDGEPLRTWSPERLLNADRVLDQLRTIFAVMRDPGFVHGDFKAANFLVGRDGYLYLIDLDAMQPKSPGRKQRKAVRRDLQRFLRNWPEQYRHRIERAIVS